MVDISLDFHNEKALLKVGGTVNGDDVVTLKDKLNEVLVSNVIILEMDLSGCVSICSSAIGKILYFYRDFQEKEGHFEIIKSSASIYDLLTTIKLNQLFPISI